MNLYNQLKDLTNYKVEIKTINHELDEVDYDEYKKEVYWEYVDDIGLPNTIDGTKILFINEEKFKEILEDLEPYSTNVFETGNEGTKANLQYKITGLFISRKKRENESSNEQKQKKVSSEVVVIDSE